MCIDRRESERNTNCIWHLFPSIGIIIQKNNLYFTATNDVLTNTKKKKKDFKEFDFQYERTLKATI